MGKLSDLCDCRKCGTSTGTFFAHHVQLIGDYNTVLCPDCLNVFHLYIEAHPTYQALQHNNVESNILVARTQGDGVDRSAEMRDNAQRTIDLESELFHVSKAWVVGEGAT